jgi:hypothetical protein
MATDEGLLISHSMFQNGKRWTFEANGVRATKVSEATNPPIFSPKLFYEGHSQVYNVNFKWTEISTKTMKYSTWETKFIDCEVCEDRYYFNCIVL